jgi:hypothetical protein
MSDPLKEIDLNMAARRKLERIASGAAVTLTEDEARRILQTLERDSKQIQSLIDSLPDDD